jgi:hypothetical protein
MDELRRGFDWPAFVTRAGSTVAVATWLLIEHRHDRAGVILIAVVGYLALPAIAYFWTRHSSMK